MVMAKWMLLAFAICLALSLPTGTLAQMPSAVAPLSSVELPEDAAPMLTPLGPVLPAIRDEQVIDIPNDAGKALGVLWNWEGTSTEPVNAVVQIEATEEMLAELELTEAEKRRLRRRSASWNPPSPSPSRPAMPRRPKWLWPRKR